MSRIFVVTVHSKCHHKKTDKSCLYCSYINTTIREILIAWDKLGFISYHRLLQYIENRNKVYSPNGASKLISVEEITYPDYVELQHRKEYDRHEE